MLQNAFDAVVDQAGEKWIEVRVDVLGKKIVLSVVDSGPGISEELVPRIMEPFFTTKPVGKGTGLGLSLSKAIAQQHGGDLKLSLRSGHTCFSLILPWRTLT
jgi:signal transduction histidine kinase